MQCLDHNCEQRKTSQLFYILLQITTILLIFFKNYKNYGIFTPTYD